MTDDDLIEVRIPLIVTADGYWATHGSHRSLADKDPDWSHVDEMCDWDNPTVNPQRYWITAYVRRPKVIEVPGAAVRDAVSTQKEPS
jgi:hypothetical protein